MGIKVNIQDAEVNRLLTTIAGRVGNLRPAMRDIGETETKRVDDRFVAERDPDGNRWIPTKVISNYLGYTGTGKGQKRKEAYTKAGAWRAAFSRYLANKKTLQLTSALRGDIHYQYDDQHVEWGTSGRIPYAGIHQFGGPAGRGKKVTIPARPYLGRNVAGGMEIAPADRQAAIEILMLHLSP